MTRKAIILIISLLITHVACNQDEKVKTVNGYQEFIINDYDPNFVFLLGRWAVCSYGDSNTAITFNVCPEVTFKENGEVISGTETQKWRVEKDTLFINALILPDGRRSPGFFTEADYLIIKFPDTTSTRIQFENLENGHYYSLGKRTSFIPRRYSQP